MSCSNKSTTIYNTRQDTLFLLSSKKRDLTLKKKAQAGLFRDSTGLLFPLQPTINNNTRVLLKENHRVRLFHNNLNKLRILRKYIFTDKERSLLLHGDKGTYLPRLNCCSLNEMKLNSIKLKYCSLFSTSIYSVFTKNKAQII